MLKSFFTVSTLLFVHFALIGQNSGLYINEIAADNTQGLSDEFREFPDWFELYNSESKTINLQGFSLTDDPHDSVKWEFPDVSINPGQYLVIFASGRDIYNVPVVWSTEVDWGDSWQYVIPDATTPSNWYEPDFDDSAWTGSKSGFGYGDGDDATLLPEGTISVYMRKSFTIDDVQNVEKGILHIDYDDAFVAYLNGVEIKRANIGTPGIPVGYNELAKKSDHEAGIYQGRGPDMFSISGIRDYLVGGENILAIEVHNAGSTSSDMTAIPFLTLGYRTFDGIPYTNDILDLPGNYMHTNFRLSRGGEFLGLYDSAGNVVDTVTFGAQHTNISFGRAANDPAMWGYFSDPTPGMENGTIAFSFSAEPVFSIPGGFYSGPQTIELSSGSPSVSIFYTLDGTLPDKNSLPYTGSIFLDSTTAVRACAIGDGEIPGEVITQTYFIDEPVNLPFISIVTDPDNLFSDERGIYVTGTNGIRGSCDPTIRNLNQDWERPVNLEFYDASGKVCINQMAGIKIFGGCSRTRFPQKSFSLFARGEYGKGSFDYQLFPDKEIYEFESFILRSSADDQNSTMMRDALAQYLQIEYMDVDYQAYRPVVVFINGAYWGIHNLREKINEHYLAENFGVDPEDVNILQGGGNAAIGASDGYLAMIDFVSGNDMSDPKNYDYIKKKMDVNQYIDYQVANIYMAESDWPGNNIKFWNTNSLAHNKWRWIMFDRDGSLRSYRTEVDELAIATATDGEGWPNPPWSTLLLRRLLTNPTFRDIFIQIFAYQMNTTFDPGRLYNMIEAFKARIEPEIPRHIMRWGGQVDPDMNESWKPGPTFSSVSQWENNVNGMKDFARRRPPYATRHIIDKFGLTGTALLEVDVNDYKSGVAKIYHKKVREGGYSGKHFKGVPIVMKAVTYPGHRFVHWTYSGPDGQKTIENAEIEIELTGTTTLTAYFADDITSEGPDVLINEINYHSPDASNSGDWVELYNNRSDYIDLSNWTLLDEDDGHVFTFSDGMELKPYGYIVVCEDMDDFKAVFQEVDDITGDLGFKFSNGGEVIRLYDSGGRLIDSVRYDDKKPWPEMPDGKGPTLELIHPALNNDLAASWTSSDGLGTPGRFNHTITGLPSVTSDSGKNSKLYHVYPNPVRTTAVIPYSIEEPGNIRLRIIDITGSEAGRIANGYRKAGSYSLRFNAGNLRNGVYLYILEVDNNFVDAGRMVVLH